MTFFKDAWRIGFHTAVGGNQTGIGDYVQQCNNAGVPAHIKNVDGTGGISDALALPQWNAPHMLVRRTSVWKEGLPPVPTPDGNPDIPNYDNDPKAEALSFFNWHEMSWPAELKAQRDKVWFEVTNEPSKLKAEWLAEFFLNVHDIALARGYKIAMFGWAMGEPEPEHWEGANMLALLKIVGDRPEDRAIALHEYSGTINGIFTMKINNDYIVIPRTDPNFGWLVGRFSKLHDVCDANNINRPRILITEFGWAYDNVPETAVAMTHLAQAQELYNEHPNITSAAIWYLGPGFGGIANKAQQLIAPVTAAAKLTPYEPADYFPPTNGGGGDECCEEMETEIDLLQAEIIELEMRIAALEAGQPTDPIDPPPDPDCCEELRAEVAALQAQVALLEGRVARLEAGQPTEPPIKPLHYRDLVVDVSAHQGSFNWDRAVSDGVKAAVLRSSNGLGSATTDENGRDLQLYRNAAECTQRGLSFAVYHFLQPGNTAAQIALVKDIHADLTARGTPPSPLILDDGTIMPAVMADVELTSLPAAEVKTFVQALDQYFIYGCGVYSSKSIWEAIMGSTAVWWSDIFAWMAQWGTNSGQIPAVGAKPLVPNGFDKVGLWQFTSKWQGGSLDMSIAGPFTGGTTPPPPTGETVNVQEYFSPVGTLGPKKVLQWLDGSQSQPQQLIRWADGTILEAKGDGQVINGVKQYDYERWRFTAVNMERLDDTSIGGNQVVHQNGARWLPVTAVVGQQYVNTPHLTVSNRSTCQVTSQVDTTDYLTITQRITSWTSPANSTIVLNDVLKIEWRKSPTGPVEEVYFVAKNIGYVAWGPSASPTVAISELPQGQQPITPQLWSCASQSLWQRFWNTLFGK